MKYKAIFFDLDGTLISLKTFQMPQSAKEALLRAKANGVKLFVATGRHPILIQANKAVNELPFDAFLAANGQFCFNSREVIHRKYIPFADKVALVRQLKIQPYPILFLAEKEIYLSMADKRVDRGNIVLQSGTAPIKDPAVCLEHEIFSLLLYGREEEDALPMSVLPHCKAVRWHPDFSDIIPSDGGKDKGIDAVLAHYGIGLDETMAFGDAQNDIAMLRHVGLGVAMGNASDEVKESADYVTDDVDEDGVYNALKQWRVI